MLAVGHEAAQVSPPFSTGLGRIGNFVRALAGIGVGEKVETNLDVLRAAVGAKGPIKVPKSLVPVLSAKAPAVSNLDVLREVFKAAKSGVAKAATVVSTPNAASAVNASGPVTPGLSGLNCSTTCCGSALLNGVGCAECGGTCGGKGLGCGPCAAAIPLLFGLGGSGGSGGSGLGDLGKFSLNIKKFLTRATHKVPILDKIAEAVPTVSPKSFIKDPLGTITSVASFVGRATNPVGLLSMGLGVQLPGIPGMGPTGPTAQGQPLSEAQRQAEAYQAAQRAQAAPQGYTDPQTAAWQAAVAPPAPQAPQGWYQDSAPMAPEQPPTPQGWYSAAPYPPSAYPPPPPAAFYPYPPYSPYPPPPPWWQQFVPAIQNQFSGPF